MGKISFSPLVDDIRGALGNAVIQQGKAGSIVRKRAIPSNPQSSAQTEVRGYVTSLSKAWAGLTESDRSGWNSAAASAAWTQTDSMGRSFQLSGEQLYLKLNLVLLNVGGAANDSVPAKEAFVSHTLSTITATAGTPSLTVAFTGTLGANESYVINCSAQGSAGIMSSKSVAFVQIAVGSGTSPVNILSAYTARFGALVAGQKFWVELQIANNNTGEMVTIGRSSKIVAA